MTADQARELYRLARMGEGYAEQRKIASEAEAEANTLAGELHATAVALSASQDELKRATLTGGRWEQRAKIRVKVLWAVSAVAVGLGVLAFAR